METIKNLRDLCNFFSAEAPYFLNKRIYKGTDCGASISIRIGEKPIPCTNVFSFVFSLVLPNGPHEVASCSCDHPYHPYSRIELKNIKENVPEEVFDFFKLESTRPGHWNIGACKGNVNRVLEVCGTYLSEGKVFKRNGNKTIEVVKCERRGEAIRIDIRYCYEEDDSVLIENGDKVSRVCVCPKCHIEFAFHPGGVDTVTCPDCHEGTQNYEIPKKIKEQKQVPCPKCSYLNYPTLEGDPDNPQEKINLRWIMYCKNCDFCIEVPDEHATQEVSNSRNFHSAWDIPINTPILGFSIQTIVEGSKADVDGEYMEVPIAVKKVQQWIDNMEEQAEFYWKRDNWRWFIVMDSNDNEYSVEMTWNGWNWEDETHLSDKDIPVEVRKEIEKLFDPDPKASSYPVPTYGYGDENAQAVPGHEGWKVYEWCNNDIY